MEGFNPFLGKDVQSCSVEGCEKVVKAKGFCATHHQQWYRTGSAALTGKGKGKRKETPTLKKCITIGCENSGHPTLVYCWACYQKMKGE